MEDRPMRPCVECNQEDDHPRHVLSVKGVGDIPRHMDCCAARGCEVCKDQISGVPEGTIGMELVQHLTTKDEVTPGASNS